MTISPKPLVAQIADLKRAMVQNGSIPQEALALIAREREALATAGVPAGAPQVGQTLPDAGLLDMNGDPVTLYGLLGGRPAVLVFYRGEWCPWCNLALHAYQEQLIPHLDKAGVPLLALSPQKPDRSLVMAQKHGRVTFTVASDPANTLARMLGILSPERSEEARAASKVSGSDAAIANIDGTDEVPMPTTLVVDASRVVRWADVSTPTSRCAASPPTSSQRSGGTCPDGQSERAPARTRRRYPGCRHPRTWERPSGRRRRAGDREPGRLQQLRDRPGEAAASGERHLQRVEAALPPANGLVWRQAVLQEAQEAAGSQHAPHLAQRGVRVGDRAQRPRGQRGVAGRRLERQPLAVETDERRPAPRPPRCARRRGPGRRGGLHGQHAR